MDWSFDILRKPDPLTCPMESKYTDLEQKLCETAVKWQKKCASDHQPVINIALLIRKHLSFHFLFSNLCIVFNLCRMLLSPNRCNNVYKLKTLFQWNLQLKTFQLTGQYFMRRNNSSIWQIHTLLCICEISYWKIRA